jgi:hypothetical protein
MITLMSSPSCTNKMRVLRTYGEKQIHLGTPLHRYLITFAFSEGT